MKITRRQAAMKISGALCALPVFNLFSQSLPASPSKIAPLTQVNSRLKQKTGSWWLEKTIAHNNSIQEVWRRKILAIEQVLLDNIEFIPYKCLESVVILEQKTRVKTGIKTGAWEELPRVLHKQDRIIRVVNMETGEPKLFDLSSCTVVG